MLSLHFAPGACSLASHIALEETGAGFEPKPISLRKGQQRESGYLKINPLGKVPVLGLDDGTTLTENTAIMTYLAKRFPAAKLLPNGSAEAEAKALSMLAWCASGIHPTFSRLFGPQRFSDLPDSKENVTALARADVAKLFTHIEGLLAGKEYVLGSYSAVDNYLFVFWKWANALGLDVSAYPTYAAHFARMSARPAVQRALAREAAAQAEFDKK
jgi:glutathione S-transferase